MEYEQVCLDLKKKVVDDNVKYIIVIPTYNEVENIEILINCLSETVKINHEILIIDDNSPDGTSIKVRELQKQSNNLHLICRNSKQGLGSAYKLGFTLAVKARFEFIISMDADLSHSPSVINTMVEEIKCNDLVIGSRYIDGAKLIGFSIPRLLLSKTLNILTKYLLNLKVADASSFYRCYRKKIFDEINLKNKIRSNRYIFAVEMLFYILANKLRIKEIPIEFVARKKGKSKISLMEIIAGIITIIRLFMCRMIKKQ